MRNQTLDIMKGVGIILVVLYHSIGTNDITVFTNYNHKIFNIIDSFFMVMFIMISGYLAYGKLENENWINRRIINWLPLLLLFTIIYWIWGTAFPDLYVIYKLQFLQFIWYQIINGFNSLTLWYVWTLICCYIIFSVGVSIPKINKTWSLIGIVIFINLIPTNMVGIGNLKWYAIFFLVGYLIRKFSDSKIWQQYKLYRLGYIGLIGFPATWFIFNWMIKYEYEMIHNPVSKNIIDALFNEKIETSIVIIITSFLGTGFVYSISNLILNKNNIVKQVIIYLGTVSLGIYLLHILFVGINDNYWISTIISLITSIILYEILKRIGIVNWLLFGIRQKKSGGLLASS